MVDSVVSEEDEIRGGGGGGGGGGGQIINWEEHMLDDILVSVEGLMSPLDFDFDFDFDFNFNVDFDFDFKLDPSLNSVLTADDGVSNASPDLVSLSIGEIEHLLMNDNDNDNDEEDKHAEKEKQNLDFSNNDIFSNFLVDSPVESSSVSGEAVDDSEGKNSNASTEEEEEEKVDDVVLPSDAAAAADCGDGNDPITKKRKRQLRNRDAAVRSRERKKMYVRDLEMKSRYLEGECKRLGMLLQCCFAENQALRLSFQNSKPFDASMTKQESAVLLLESLLLGSLLWFLGLVCLLILPRPLHPKVEVLPPESVVDKNQGSLVPRKVRSKIFGLRLFQSFIMGKRYKASRFRMKPSFLRLEVLV